MANVNFFDGLRIFASSTLNIGAAGCYAAGDALTAASKAVAGEQWNSTLFSDFIEAHGLEEAVEEIKKEAEEKHSKYATWDKWHWVPSELAVKEGKSLPALYKAANSLIYAVKYGVGNTFAVKTSEGKEIVRTNGEWAQHYMQKHVDFMADKGVKMTPEKVYELAKKLSKLGDKCPGFEEIFGTAAPAPTEAAPEAPAPAAESAPKAEPKAAKKRPLAELYRLLGVTRVTEANCVTVAEKAYELRQNGDLSEEEQLRLCKAAIKKATDEESVAIEATLV